jgi:hypothetical protein
VPFSMVVVGTRVYLMLSSHIIIVTRPVWRCHRSRLYMAGNAGFLYIGSDWRKTVLWIWTYSRGRRTSLYNQGELEGGSDQEKSYADNRRRPLEFEEGDHVYLKVSPLRGMRRFKVKGKLSPRYIRPF